MKVVRLRASSSRIIGAAAVAVLAAATLSSCRTNVGVAADIDGQHVSESQVSSYLTSSSKPVAIGQSTTSPPRVFVLDVLILGPYFRKVVSASSVGNVTDSKLAAAHAAALDGRSDAAIAAEIGVHGYTDAFDKLVVDLSILARVRSQLSGTELAKIDSTLSFPVQLNPRYGTWSRDTLFIDSSSSAGVSNFLKLQPAGTGSS